jgi:four helix bundle protein
MNKFRFLEWKVYKESKDLFSFMLKLVKKLPKEYRFELGSQIIRAALSVVLNIAEGSGKTSDKELNRFLNISLGSTNEVLAATDVMYYNGFITKNDFDDVMNRIDSISSQLGGFKKKLEIC